MDGNTKLVGVSVSVCVMCMCVFVCQLFTQRDLPGDGSWACPGPAWPESTQVTMDTFWTGLCHTTSHHTTPTITTIWIRTQSRLFSLEMHLFYSIPNLITLFEWVGVGVCEGVHSFVSPLFAELSWC